jgi:hypothetical protein
MAKYPYKVKSKMEHLVKDVTEFDHVNSIGGEITVNFLTMRRINQINKLLEME